MNRQELIKQLTFAVAGHVWETAHTTYDEDWVEKRFPGGNPTHVECVAKQSRELAEALVKEFDT